MPARSKVAMLPAEVRTELERRIRERAFSGYQELAQWLQAQGYCIAHDSVQRYGLRLRQKIESMTLLAEEAQALSAAAPLDTGSLIDATVRLLHYKVLSILLNEAEPEGCEEAKRRRNRADPARGEHLAEPPATALTIRDLARLTRILADLNRITIARQPLADQIKLQLEQPQSACKGSAPTDCGRSEKAYRAIRNVLPGIDPFDPAHREGSARTTAPDWEARAATHDEELRTRRDSDERTSTLMSAVLRRSGPAPPPAGAQFYDDSSPSSLVSGAHIIPGPALTVSSSVSEKRRWFSPASLIPGALTLAPL